MFASLILASNRVRPDAVELTRPDAVHKVIMPSTPAPSRVALVVLATHGAAATRWTPGTGYTICSYRGRPCRDGTGKYNPQYHNNIPCSSQPSITESLCDGTWSGTVLDGPPYPVPDQGWSDAEWLTIPTALFQNTRLSWLSLSRISGTLPTHIGLLTQLIGLDLGRNSLYGTLPTQIGLLTQLRDLRLNRNSLSGTIPTEVGNLTQLRRLNLMGKTFDGEGGRLVLGSLSGTIPTEVANLTQFTELSINSQRLSGTIPTALFQNTLLSGLSLHENSLSGTLPTQLGLLTRLRQLKIDNNRLSGTLVTEIGGLTRLSQLYLHANSFSGSLPTELYLLNRDSPGWDGGPVWEAEGDTWDGRALGCYGKPPGCGSRCKLTVTHCDPGHEGCRYVSDNNRTRRHNTNNFDCPVPKLPAACAQFDIGVCDCYTDDNRTCGTTYALAIGIPSLAVIAIAMYILRRACRKGACRKGKDPSSVEGVTEDRNTSDVRL